MKLTIDPIIDAFSFTHKKILELVENLSEEEMVIQTDFERKHAMWVVGHIVVIRDCILIWSGLKPLSPENWNLWFGNNAYTISNEVLVDKNELLEIFNKSYHQVISVLSKLNDEKFYDPIIETNHNFLNKQHGIVFESTIHEGLHLGQLRTLIEYLINNKQIKNYM